MSIRDTIKQIYTYYADRELDKLLDFLPDDFSLHWPYDAKVARYAGLYSSKNSLAEQLQDLADNFEFHSYTATNILVDGDRAAAQVDLEMTAKNCGTKISATLAHFWEFENGQPIRVTEYNDSALLTHYAVARSATP